MVQNSSEVPPAHVLQDYALNHFIAKFSGAKAPSSFTTFRIGLYHTYSLKNSMPTLSHLFPKK